MYDYISRQRNPRTKIWPRLANPITDRGWKSKDASATYGDVYDAGFISGLPQGNGRLVKPYMIPYPVGVIIG